MDNSVPTETNQRNPSNSGKGSSKLYTNYSSKRAAVELLTAYKWPLVISLIILAGLVALYGAPSIPSPPAEFWMIAGYFVGGAGLALLPSYLIVQRLREPSGIELAELDPVTGEHRHLRIGRGLWEDAVILWPDGGKASKSDLAQCRINGRSGYEVMDLRISEDGRPVMAATEIGGMSTSQLRTYENVLKYIRKRLISRARKADLFLSNREHIIEEAVEQQMHQMIMTSERSGLPDGESVDKVVETLLNDLEEEHDLGSEDIEAVEQMDRWTPGDPNASNGSEPNEPTVEDIMRP